MKERTIQAWYRQKGGRTGTDARVHCLDTDSDHTTTHYPGAVAAVAVAGRLPRKTRTTTRSGSC